MRLFTKSFLLFLAFFLHLVVSPLELAGHFWDKLFLKDKGGIFFGPPEVYAKVLEKADSVLRRNFPEADSFDEEIKRLKKDDVDFIEEKAGLNLHPYLDRKFVFRVAKAQGNVLGYAVEDIVPGKWGPIHYLVTIDPEGNVADVAVLEYRERRGKPVAKRRFLKQFIGKGVRDDLRLRRDIKGVTGASISSRGMTDGVRKLVHVFKFFYGS